VQSKLGVMSIWFSAGFVQSYSHRGRVSTLSLLLIVLIVPTNLPVNMTVQAIPTANVGEVLNGSHRLRI